MWRRKNRRVWWFLSFSGAAAGYEGYTAKDHCGGEDFLPTEGIHAYVDADDNGDDGLHVGVHAHKRWAYALLSNGNEQVGDKGGEDNEEREFEDECVRQCSIINRYYLAAGNGK